MNLKMKLNQVLLLGIFIISVMAGAQPEDLNVRDPRVNEGKLFTIQFTPGDHKLVVSVAGKPSAVLGPNEVTLFGRQVTRSGKSLGLRFKSTPGGFEILDKISPLSKLEIGIEEKASKKKETFQIVP